MVTEAAATITNRGSTRKAGSKSTGNAAPTKRAARKSVGEQQEQGLPLGEALEKSKGHLTGGGEQSAGKQVEGDDTSGKDTASKPARRKKADEQTGGGKQAGNDGQQGANQTGGGDNQQGAASAGEIRLGSKQVLILDVEMPGRGGKPPSTDESYPFAEMGLSIKLPNGRTKGPSFFVPNSEKPDAVIAAGRKRLRGQDVSIVTRKVSAEDASVMGYETTEPGVLVSKIAGAGK